MANLSDVLESAAAIAKGMTVTFKEMMSPALTEEYPDGPPVLKSATAVHTFYNVMEMGWKNAWPVSLCGGVSGRLYLYRGRREYRPAKNQRRRTVRKSL